MVQNSFLRIKDYKSCLLWVIIDFWGVPPFFFIYTEICCRRFVFLIHSDWIPIKIIAPWCFGPRTLQVFYPFSTDFPLNWLCIDLTHIGRARRGMVRPTPVRCGVWWAMSPAYLSLQRLPTALQRGINPAHTTNSFSTGHELHLKFKNFYVWPLTEYFNDFLGENRAF